MIFAKEINWNTNSCGYNHALVFGAAIETKQKTKMKKERKRTVDLEEVVQLSYYCHIIDLRLSQRK